MPSKKIITKLTDEQEALIPEYRDKWRSVQNSVEIINYDKIIEALIQRI